MQFGIIKHCTEVNATAYGGTPDENPEMSSEMGEVVAMSGVGINIGLVKDGEDASNVIDNGLVLPQWITAKAADGEKLHPSLLATTMHTHCAFCSVIVTVSVCWSRLYNFGQIMIAEATECPEKSLRSRSGSHLSSPKSRHL